MAKITILGAGAWGTAFAQVLADAGNHVVMWDIDAEVVDEINRNHSNLQRLPTLERLPDPIKAESDRARALEDSDLVVVSIAAQHAGEALEQFKSLVGPSQTVVSLMKGIERGTGRRMDQVVCQTLHLDQARFAAVSGPNLSKEVADRQPCATLVASLEADTAMTVARACTTEYFKAFVSDDVIGLEMCGSLKNVTALAVGISRGAGYGENTAAMIQARGLAELTALGTACGAKAATFAGLAGVGDLVATCGSPLSRNYTFGFNLGQGKSVEEATRLSKGVAEGVPTTQAVIALGKQYGVPTPLATAVGHVLDQGLDCRGMIGELLGGNITGE